MGYKAVCFDIDGTLYPAKVMNRRLLALGLRHPVFAMKYNRMRRSYRELQDGFEGDPSLKDASLRDAALGNASLRVREAVILQKNYGVCRNKDIGLVVDRLDSWIYRPMEKLYRKTTPYDGVVRTFQSLKEKGALVGVFSDFPLFDKLGSMGLSQYVDFAASSEDVGFLKPSVHCFEHLLYNMGLKPSEVLYVGDSYSKDVVGAHSAGMDAVLVNSKGGAGMYPLACGVFHTWADFDGWLSGRMEDV